MKHKSLRSQHLRISKRLVYIHIHVIQLATSDHACTCKLHIHAWSTRKLHVGTGGELNKIKLRDSWNMCYDYTSKSYKDKKVKYM